MESFFLISSASLDLYPDNTRAVFTNTLPKDFNKDNKLIYLNLEKVIFSNSYLKYESSVDEIPDIIYRYQKDYYTFKLKSVETVTEVFNEICHFLNECAEKRNLPTENFYSAILFENKIEIVFLDGDVLMSDRLKELLMIHNKNYMRKKDIKTMLFYNIIRTPADGRVNIKSHDCIRLNEKKLPYIKIYFEEAELQGGDKVIAKIPIKNQLLNYYEPNLAQYFRVDKSYLTELKVTFLQPNNCRVFFQDGTPNILKFNVQTDIQNMDFFYLTVSSKSTPSFNDNNCNNFTFESMKDYDFSDKWEVCVLNAYVPRPQGFLWLNPHIYQITNNENYIGMRYQNLDGEYKSHFMIIPFQQFRRRQLYMFIEKFFSEMINIYVDQNEVGVITQKENVKTNGGMVQIYTSKVIFQILNNYFLLEEVNKDTQDVWWQAGFHSLAVMLNQNRILPDYMTGISISDKYMENLMKRKHLFLIPPSIFYPQLKDEDITSLTCSWENLTKSPNFLANHEYNLLMYLETMNFPEFREFTPSFFFLYCDFVEETVMGNKFVNILKIIPYKNNNTGMFNFAKEEYYNVNKSYLRTLSFQLKTHCGETYAFFPKNTDVELTLKFRKKK